MNLPSSKKWKTVRLSDVAEKIAMGPFGSNIKVETFIDKGVPVISGDHLRSFRLTDNKYNFVTEDHAERLKNSLVYRGDVIFTHAGNIGQVAYIPQDSKYDKYVISQRQFYLRCNKDKILPEFITYFFTSRLGQHVLLANASQTGVPSIAQPSTYLKSIEVALPSISDQRSIAALLGSLDDKIELLRAENCTLERMAQAIFKEWFVDFRFPGAVGATVDSELGPIPAGWRVGKLGEVCDITIGRTPPRKEEEWFSMNPKDVKWISIRDLGIGGVYISQTLEYLTKEAVEKFNVPIIPKNTVVVSFKLTLGRAAITTEPMLSNEAIAHLKIKEGNNLSTEFLYLFIKNFDFNTLGSTSSIATAVNSQSIKGIEAVVPEPKVLENFDSAVKPFFVKLLNNSNEMNGLSMLRDELMDKIFTE